MPRTRYQLSGVVVHTLSSASEDRRSRKVLVILRLQAGRASCHHPDHLFTRVSNAPASASIA